MKKIICLTIVFGVLLCGGASIQKAKLPAQEKETKLEAFEKQTGTVFIRGRSKIGSVSGMGNIEVGCIETLDVSTGQRQMGIVLEVKGSGRYENSESSFIDYDEIDSLLNGIDYIAKVKLSSTKLSNFEAIYKTTGELSFITYSSSNGKIEAVIVLVIVVQ